MNRVGYGSSKIRIVVITLVFTIAILCLGIAFIYFQESSFRKQSELELSAIADLKAKQLVEWRQERIDDAESIILNHELINNFANLIEHSQIESIRNQIKNWLSIMSWSTMYEEILITDSNGIILVSEPSDHNAGKQYDIQSSHTETHKDSIRVVDFYRSSNGNIYIEFQIPIYSKKIADQNKLLGLIILKVNAANFIYPELQEFPIPSASAECLLVRRDGDSVVYLNELRHRKNTALQLKFALRDTALPAVKVVLGRRGICEDTDYRHVKVIAALREIPSSPWFLVTKIDSKEINQSLRYSETILSVALLLLIGAVWAIFAVIVGKLRLHDVQNRLDREQERSELLYQIESLMRYANDSIFLLDSGFSIIDANLSAQTAFNVSQDAMIGKNFTVLFGKYIDIDFQTVLLISGDAKETTWEADIRDRNSIVYPAELTLTTISHNRHRVYQLVICDISDRKKWQNALIKSSEEISDLYNNAPCGYHSIDSDGYIVRINDTELSWLGYSREEIVNQIRFVDLLTEASRGLFLERFEYLKTDSEIQNIELSLIRKDGLILPVLHNASALKTEDGKFILSRSTIFDLTERKKIEAVLLESEERFRRAFEEGPLGVVLVDPQLNFIKVNQAFAQIVGYTTEEIESMSVKDITHPDYYENDVVNVIKLHEQKISIYKTEKVYIHKDGHFIWVSLTVTPIRSADGKKSYQLGMIEDITEKKLNEARLYRSNRSLRMLSDCNQVLIRAKSEVELIQKIGHTIYTRGGYPIVAVMYIDQEDRNRLKIVTSSSDEEIYRNDAKLVWEATDLVNTPFYQAMKERTHVIWSKDDDFNSSIWWSEAEKFNFSYSISLPMYEFGHLIGVLNICSNDSLAFHDEEELKLLLELTDDLSFGISMQRVEVTRNLIEADLKAANEFTVDLIRTANTMIIGMSMNGRISIFNEAAEKISGYSIDDLQCKNWIEVLIPRDVYPDVWLEFQKLSQGGIPKQFDSPILTKHGEERYITWSNNQIYRYGSIDSTISFGIDITELQHTRQNLLKSNRALRMLSDCNQVLIRSSDELDLLNRVCQVIHDEGNYPIVNVSYRDPNNQNAINSMITISETGIDRLSQSKKYPFSETFKQAIETGKAVISSHLIEESNRSPRQTEINTPNFTSFVCLPLNIDGRSIGALSLFSDQDGAFDSEEMRLLIELADDLSYGINSFRTDLQRHRAELELQEREYWLSESQRVSRLGSYNFDIPNDCWSCSQVLSDVFGFKYDYKKKMQDWIDAVHPEDRQAMIDYFSKEVVGRKQPFDREYRIVRKSDNEIRWVWGKGQITYDAMGNPINMIGTIQDITDRKLAEIARAEADKKHRDLFTQSRDGVFITNIDGTFIDINDAMVSIVGFSIEELLSMKSSDLYFNPEERIQYQKEIELTGSVSDYEIRLQRKDGKIITCQLSANVRHGDSGQIIGYQGFCHDISSRKQIQEQLVQSQKMEAIGRLASGVAHDFNNLLTIITGNAELMNLSIDQTNPLRERLASIIETVTRATALTRQLLLFSRKNQQELEIVNLNDIIHGIVKMLQRLIGENIDLIVETYSGLPNIEADPRQIEQIIMNLVINSRDAMTDDGELTISTNVFESAESKDSMTGNQTPICYSVLTVHDTGVGMSSEVLACATEPFFTTKPEGKGTGLGLSTVQSIVQQLNGKLEIESEINIGTTIKVFIPAVAVNPIPKVNKVEEKSAGRNELILVVEDEEAIRDLLHFILTQHGYRVLRAANGVEALQILEQDDQTVDAVISDVVMPQMGGVKLLEKMREKFSNVKVLFMSGYTTEESIQSIQDSGFPIIMKPFNTKHVLSELRKIIDGE